MVASPAILTGVHGGPDALGVPAHDFSTNSNACGPCPAVLDALQQADATRYPDPAYTALRTVLAALHGVAPDRIVVAGSASEFIHRITTWARLHGCTQVQLPPHSYGDYARLPGTTDQPSCVHRAIWRSFQLRRVGRQSATHCCTAGVAQASNKATP